MKGKPFIKWVGGKGQLLSQLDELLPSSFASIPNITYIEPFVGGGAMLFYMLQTYPNIQRVIINDLNQPLITCYQIIRDRPQELISELSRIQTIYLPLSEPQRKEFYLEIRSKFNTRRLDDVSMSALLIFLNRTCFNGLYRENRSGHFNVPFGKYTSPTICDEVTIMEDSRLLQKTEILCGDYQQTRQYIQGNTFFYFDPPYRPLNTTSSFNDYTKKKFNDEEQKRLKDFCDEINNARCNFMLSNSACQDGFFEKLYQGYDIQRVLASRSINANPDKRGKLTELLIRNYNNVI
ncbi:MAG: DNA adenine methylase [Prevotellaceae bacterium]|nr:DNA adenine methylase [Candidatus Colicola caccequi]MBQ0089636.1 DNA adenine methylase [Candidatus Faecinaster equi]